MLLLYVLLGGALGAGIRYTIFQFMGKTNLYYETILVNILGALLGAFSYYFLQKNIMSEGIRLFLFTGLIGAITTHYKMIEDLYNMLIVEHAWVKSTCYLFLSIVVPLLLFSYTVHYLKSNYGV